MGSNHAVEHNSLSLCSGLTNFERAEEDLRQHQAYLAAFWQHLLAIYDGYDDTAALPKDMPASAGLNGSADRFYYDMLSACKGRSFFVTNQGYCGLLPFATKPKEQCFVLNGARVSFVLRTAHEGTQKLVGECYVHNILGGSFVDGPEMLWQDLNIIWSSQFYMGDIMRGRRS